MQNSKFEIPSFLKKYANKSEDVAQSVEIKDPVEKLKRKKQALNNLYGRKAFDDMQALANTYSDTDDKKSEFDEINSITNPAVKTALLKPFSDVAIKIKKRGYKSVNDTSTYNDALSDYINSSLGIPPRLLNLDHALKDEDISDYMHSPGVYTKSSLPNYSNKRNELSVNEKEAIANMASGMSEMEMIVFLDNVPISLMIKKIEKELSNYQSFSNAISSAITITK